jgi:hypothetical protein
MDRIAQIGLRYTIKLGPVQLTSDEHQVIRHARADADN